MDSRMVARLEEDLAKSACHEQTGGVLNGGMAVRVRAKCAGAWLCGGRGGSKGWEGMVREATVTSLEKASNSAFSLIGPETLKNWKEDSFSKFCARGPRLVRRRPVDPAWKKGHMSSQLCRWPDQAREQPRSGQTGSYGRR